MKRIGLGLVLAIAIVIIVGGLVTKQIITSQKSLPTPTAISAPTQPQSQFCEPKNLEGSISSEGAAGNIYLTATVKNISSKECKIVGDNFIDASFSAKNVKIMQQGQMGPNIISLSPNQTVYSQMHFSNGPQCSSPIKQISVSFAYKISDNTSITFVSNDNTPITITACTASTQITQLDVWSISLQPLH